MKIRLPYSVRVARPVRAALVLVLAATTMTFVLGFTLRLSPPPPAVLNGFAGAECGEWDPADPSTDARCRGAARRLREAQAFLSDPVYAYDEGALAAVRRVEACALGLVFCPDRPLIVSLWPQSEPEDTFSAEVERRAELAWREDVAEGIAQFNYVFVPQNNRTLALHLVRSLRASLHQVWMGEHAALECMQNPRCIANDYVPPEDPSMVPNITAVAAHERGPVDLWRLMVTSWAPGRNLTDDWGVPTSEEGREENWSFNPLGQRHTISPYEFPGHAWVPFTHAVACDSSTFTIPRKPNAVRGDAAQRTVLILGDAADVPAAQINWARIWLLLHGRGINATFTLATLPSAPLTPLEGGWVTPVPADPAAYPDLLGAADALVGLGSAPHVPTTAYVAMCRGTPAVFAVLKDMGQLDLWERFDASWVQHGQYYTDEPEPYGYKYPAGDSDRLGHELWKALVSGKSAHTPRQFGPLGLYENLEAVLHHDYWGEYREQRKKRDGPVGLADDLRAHCWKKGWCRRDL